MTEGQVAGRPAFPKPRFDGGSDMVMNHRDSYAAIAWGLHQHRAVVFQWTNAEGSDGTMFLIHMWINAKHISSTAQTFHASAAEEKGGYTLVTAIGDEPGTPQVFSPDYTATPQRVEDLLQANNEEDEDDTVYDEETLEAVNDGLADLINGVLGALHAGQHAVEADVVAADVPLKLRWEP